MMYQMETYICWYLRVAMVHEDIDAEHHPGDHHQDVERHAAVRRIPGPGCSPAGSATTAPRMITFQSTAVATPSFSLHSLTPHSRGTM